MQRRFNMKERHECPVCLDELKSFVCPWTCMHKFHEKCTNTLNSCPLCRNTMPCQTLNRKQKFRYLFRLWYYRNLCKNKIIPSYYLQQWDKKTCIINTHQIEFEEHKIPPFGIIGTCTNCQKTQCFNRLCDVDIRQNETIKIIW